MENTIKPVKVSDTTARIIRLKAMLNDLEKGILELTNELNGGTNDLFGDNDMELIYAETAAIDRRIEIMLNHSANIDALNDRGN